MAKGFMRKRIVKKSSQEKEDEMTDKMMKRVRTKSRGVKMTRSLLGLHV